MPQHRNIGYTRLILTIHLSVVPSINSSLAKYQKKKTSTALMSVARTDRLLKSNLVFSLVFNVPFKFVITVAFF